MAEEHKHEIDDAFRVANEADTGPLWAAYKAGTLRDALYSPITQLHIQQLLKEEEKAKEALLFIDPADATHIIELQIMGRQAEVLKGFLHVAFEAGDSEAEEYDAEVARDAPRESGPLR